jgi:hypothetical protein
MSMEDSMKFEILKVIVSIDHLTLTSDDRRIIKYNHKILSKYHYEKSVPTEKSDRQKHMSRTYRSFHEYWNLRTGNKLHVFVERFNTDTYKTLFVPNITLKFFSSWGNKLTYADVVYVHNVLVEKYNVLFSVSAVHVAIDLFFWAEDNPFMEVLGCIKSGRKIEPWQHPKYPYTWFFHRLNARYCQAVYDKKYELLNEPEHRAELTPMVLQELDGVHVTRLESRFRYPYPGLPSLGELATWDFSFIYPRHLKFLTADREKLANQGINPKQYRGLSLAGLRALLSRLGITNNFTYHLREIKRLADPVEAALGVFRWDRHPDRHPLSVPRLKIRKQRLKFIKHS